jgi:hypothetical protein
MSVASLNVWRPMYDPVRYTDARSHIIPTCHPLTVRGRQDVVRARTTESRPRGRLGHSPR